MEEKKSFRWYEFDTYGEKNSPTNAKIASELTSVYNALFQIMGYVTGKSFSLEEIIQFAKEQRIDKENGTLADILKKKFDLSDLDVKKEEEKKERN